MSKTPSVSIVIPLYNKALYIERAVRSVLAQTYQDFELIVVDDGSTDEGPDIVANMSDPRIRLIRQDNKGEGAARNRGIRESQGALIAMLDGDDEWCPEFLAAIVSLSKRYPEAGIYATGYQTRYPRNLVIETTIAPVSQSRQNLVRDYFAKARVANFVWSSAQAIPCCVYSDVGLFVEGEPMGPDLDMWGRIASKYPVAYDCRTLAIYHNEAVGRVVTSWAKKPTFPPFVRSARQTIEHGELSPDLITDLHEYMNHLLLQYARRVIAAGDRAELQRTLDEEFYPSRVYHSRMRFLRCASRILPMQLLYLLERMRTSRYVAFLRCHQLENGVIRRVVPVAKIQE